MALMNGRKYVGLITAASLLLFLAGFPYHLATHERAYDGRYDADPRAHTPPTPAGADIEPCGFCLAHASAGKIDQDVTPTGISSPDSFSGVVVTSAAIPNVHAAGFSSRAPPA